MYRQGKNDISRGTIQHFDCDQDGFQVGTIASHLKDGKLKDSFKKNKENVKDELKRGHYYILLSDDRYNRISSTILAIPLASNPNMISKEWAEKLEPDDFVGCRLKSGSWVLCDRPCRVHKDHMTKLYDEDGCYGYIKRKIVNELCEKIKGFMVAPLDTKC